MLRPRRAATVDAHAGGAGGRDHRHAGVAGERLADVGVADGHLHQPVGRVAEAVERPLEDAQGGERRERGLLRRLPDHGVAADEGERRVPRPDGHREVERGDHPAGTDRVPRLPHRVPGALRGDGEAVELAGHADGEVADVDHLLDLAEALLADLPALEGHEGAERVLRRAQLLAQQADELAPAGRRHVAPRVEGLGGPLDGAVHAGGVGGGHRGEDGAVDGGADLEVAPGELIVGQADGSEDALVLVHQSTSAW
jgi:hypothetical protein